jgi:gamma-glutamyl hydrolase
MKILYICFLWLAVVNSLPEQFPVIGIYTQSDQSDEPTGEVPRAKPLKGSNYTYIAASYVKYIQMSGAQVVPIFAYSDQPYFDDILPKLNGVLFPGSKCNIKAEMWNPISTINGPKTPIISSNTR